MKINFNLFKKKGIKLEVRSEHSKAIREDMEKLKTLVASTNMNIEEFLDNGKKVLAGSAKRQLKQIKETTKSLIKKCRAAEADMLELPREEAVA